MIANDRRRSSEKSGVELKIIELEVDPSKDETHLHITKSTVSEKVKRDAINYEYKQH